MKQFSDFAEDTNLDGTKVKMSEIIGKQIYLMKFLIFPSTIRADERCLKLQFRFINVVNGAEQVGDEDFVVFTGSEVLMNIMEHYKNELPFAVTVQKRERGYRLV